MPGKIMIIFKITPKNFKQIGELVAEVKALKFGEVKEVRVEEIGFGIQVVKAGILINEKEENALEKLEEEINKLELVESSKVEGMTLL